MSIVYRRVQNEWELDNILDLQGRNLPGQLSETEKSTQGFVTVVHDRALLLKMNEVCPHIVAMDGDVLAGYTLCMHPDFKNEIPILKPMFKQLEGIKGLRLPYMVMGQVCIDKPYRGKGVFRQLYAALAQSLESAYGAIITEVDRLNTRSLQAHYAIGFEELQTYFTDEKEWIILQLPLVNSPLS